MEIWQALILGFAQGLTEFLPVSSSGHLVFLQSVMNVDLGDLEMFFDIILHLGTLVAVCAIFWKDILNLFKKPFKTLIYLIVATIPAAIAGLLLEDWIDKVFYGGAFLAAGFLITAIVLFATEIYAKKSAKALPLCWRVTVPMGLAQVVALLPGISRSGSTIAAGTFAGGDREQISHFSFLMSIPVILGSFAVSLLKGLVNGEIQSSFQIGGANFGWCIAVGFIASVIAGLLAIKVMLKAIKNANYKWFSLYLVLLAIACIILQHYGYLG